MKISYDKEVDAFYIYFKTENVKVARTIVIKPDFHLDVDENGGHIGLEVLNLSLNREFDPFEVANSKPVLYAYGVKQQL